MATGRTLVVEALVPIAAQRVRKTVDTRFVRASVAAHRERDRFAT
jgi:hypothetical protein